MFTVLTIRGVRSCSKRGFPAEKKKKRKREEEREENKGEEEEEEEEEEIQEYTQTSAEKRE